MLPGLKEPDLQYLVEKRLMQSGKLSEDRLSSKKEPIRVILLDSSHIFRESLARAIVNSGELVLYAEAGTPDQLSFKLEMDFINVVLVELDLPNPSAVEFRHRLANISANTAVIFIVDQDSDINLTIAWVTRAAGILLRRQNINEFIQAIRQAAVGVLYSSDQYQRIQTWQSTIGTKLTSLRPREWHVFWLLSIGKTNQEISQELSLTENTVEKHVTSVLQKMEVTSRSSLFAYILSNNLHSVRLLQGKDFLISPTLLL
jgi:DNA-binding NarL/FixJ family response regulator